MTLMVARWLLALGWLRPRAHPPIPPRTNMRRSLLSIHVLNATYTRSINK
jgi:hypothetical protein